jgi:hypothetical protein
MLIPRPRSPIDYAQEYENEKAAIANKELYNN